MTDDESTQFAKRPYADDAVLLRRYDDGAGKRSGADVADLSHFRSMLEDLHARNVRL